ncbi:MULTISPECIES: ABC transporter permease [unclassified Mycolicibacterium]|uniref:ABC transporter permease n=1 Tax=unclassified Mycolicibacterium TaxID=2636767 RepID=UPI00192E4C3E|nr:MULTISPECIES: ABC transporter permease [unclassified Mycolicibacterium]
MNASISLSWAVKRVIALVVTLAVGSLLIYGAMFVSPGDPATLLVGGSKPSPEALAAARAEFHLDEPFWQSYARWLGGALHGDFGISLINRAPVGEMVASRLGTTVFLVAYAAVFIVIGGVVLGVLAGWRGGRTATAMTSLTTVLMAAPTFAVAVILIAVFASGLGWFPVFGGGTGFLDQLWHLTLPAASLGFAWIAYVANITQEAVRREITSEHVETARSRGIAESSIIWRHVVRNASGPIVAVNGLSIAGIFAATSVAEQAFGVNGIGSLLVQSAARQDIVTVQAVTLIMIAAFVVVNTLVDMLSAILDPRLAGGVTA